MQGRPELHPDVTVADGVDLVELWDEFEFFEALHHHLEIMNPLSSADLDTIIDAVTPTDGERILDVGCGHGELLIRMAERAQIEGVGIDLSPWQADRAARRAVERGVGELLWFWVGHGAETPTDRRWDVAALLGVSWIWGGFAGTLDALIERSVPGGLIVFGDIYLKEPLQRAAMEEAYGPTLTHAEELGLLRAADVTVLDEVQTSPEDWIRYDQETAEGLRLWMESHPDDVQLAERHAEWVEQHAEDHQWMGWTVWIGRTAD